jgi:hypothetical protein
LDLLRGDDGSHSARSATPKKDLKLDQGKVQGGQRLKAGGGGGGS